MPFPFHIPDFLSGITGFFTSPAGVVMLQVILIDIVLAGDNAVVIGLVAARVPEEKRARVIFWGLVVAVVLRVILAVSAAKLLQIIGLMFAGGILLLWVSWRLWRDIEEAREKKRGTGADSVKVSAKPFSMRHVVFQVVVADLSMSLDNVLAVAGAAMNHVWVLAVGLVLSVALMGLAANLIAKILNKHPWISYAGLILVIYVALSMIWRGGNEILETTQDAQITRSNSAVASSLFLKRGKVRPSGSSASMARSSSASTFSPFDMAALTSWSASYAW
ncbi:MAG TPA: TerC family protein [Rhizomicrobium sp.]|jgi:YjbE family integral membrane protein|nr:TerC family protein [Rhizomicrobium sp.]